MRLDSFSNRGATCIRSELVCVKMAEFGPPDMPSTWLTSCHAVAVPPKGGGTLIQHPAFKTHFTRYKLNENLNPAERQPYQYMVATLPEEQEGELDTWTLIVPNLFPHESRNPSVATYTDEEGITVIDNGNTSYLLEVHGEFTRPDAIKPSAGGRLDRKSPQHLCRYYVLKNADKTRFILQMMITEEEYVLCGKGLPYGGSSVLLQRAMQFAPDLGNELPILQVDNRKSNAQAFRMSSLEIPKGDVSWYTYHPFYVQRPNLQLISQMFPSAPKSSWSPLEFVVGGTSGFESYPLALHAKKEAINLSMPKLEDFADLVERDKNRKRKAMRDEAHIKLFGENVFMKFTFTFKGNSEQTKSFKISIYVLYSLFIRKKIDSKKIREFYISRITFQEEGGRETYKTEYVDNYITKQANLIKDLFRQTVPHNYSQALKFGKEVKKLEYGENLPTVSQPIQKQIFLSMTIDLSGINKITDDDWKAVERSARYLNVKPDKTAKEYLQEQMYTRGNLLAALQAQTRRGGVLPALNPGHWRAAHPQSGASWRVNMTWI